MITQGQAGFCELDHLVSYNFLSLQKKAYVILLNPCKIRKKCVMYKLYVSPNSSPLFS